MSELSHSLAPGHCPRVGSEGHKALLLSSAGRSSRRDGEQGEHCCDLMHPNSPTWTFCASPLQPELVINFIYDLWADSSKREKCRVEEGGVGVV